VAKTFMAGGAVISDWTDSEFRKDSNGSVAGFNQVGGPGEIYFLMISK
jgi:hypothetical protein